jgi:hypothetical protein
MPSMTSAAMGRGLLRDPSDDAETRVYVKPAMPWDRVMVLQIMRDLEPGKRITPAPPVPSPPAPAAAGRSNVFLTPLPTDAPPPWSAPAKAARNIGGRNAAPRVVAQRAEGARAEGARAEGRKVLRRERPPRQVVREEETLVRPRWRHQAPRRMMLPWVLFFMYFSIAFGVGQDQHLRKQTISELRTAASVSVNAVQSSAIWLWRFVSGIDT